MVISKKEKKALVLAARNATTPIISLFPHLIICGPSGCGKSTLIQNDPQSIVRMKPSVYEPLITASTRVPRAFEVNGKDYLFMSPEDFKREVFFETNEYLGNEKLYGTPVSEIERIAIKMRKRMVLNIDPNGAIEVEKEFERDVFTVFLNTSLPVLEKRLLGRLEKTGETKEDVRKRLIAAEKEHMMVQDKIFVPDFILPYDDISPGEATNVVLFEAQRYCLAIA